ncbi:hypothetical protein [Chondromyces apiculatus]|uniref:Cell wall/surface repeat protein n=1 Tax=Chondromyces apiculatus DSM 436 TaxID=1192034 RepID=A0A017SU49_9BACT|nr:hypothetical protein [Chondromyces apiculatus]EYF00110.1 cell wall/surface repeat protein [Chondromyces apiculatus DSM 436]
METDGHLALARGEVVEHLRNVEEGVEQSFSFAERPAGEGDLDVRVHVSGQEYAGETPLGHHFVDPATGIGLRYGRATWIDGRGETASLPVRYGNGELTITVPEELVEGSAYPAVLDPIVSPELGVDSPIYRLASGDQMAPDIAFDGTNYLVVWNAPDCLASNTTPYEIRGVRVSPAGTLLDPTVGRLLHTATAYGSTPVENVDLAFGGTNYLVVWNGNVDLYGMRVDTSATALGAFPISKLTNVTELLPCTSADGCTNGACSGIAVVCTALDECHLPGAQLGARSGSPPPCAGRRIPSS